MIEPILVKIQGREYAVELTNGSAIVNGQKFNLDDFRHDDKGGVGLAVDGQNVKAVIERGSVDSYLMYNGREFTLEVETPRDRLMKRLSPSTDGAGGIMAINASMPGLVLRLIAEPGSKVKRGDPVLILEAMKMENEIRAPGDGTVKEIKVSEGQAVEKGDPLVVLEA